MKWIFDLHFTGNPVWLAIILKGDTLYFITGLVLCNNMETLTGVRYIGPTKDPKMHITAATYVLDVISCFLNRSLKKSQFGIH